MPITEKLVPLVMQPSPVITPTPEKLPLAESAGVIGVAILIGISHYIYKVATKELAFSWLRLLSEGLLSGVAGYLSWSLCISFGVSTANMGFLVGLSGWAGSKAMTFFETITMRVIEKHFGVVADKEADVEKVSKD